MRYGFTWEKAQYVGEAPPPSPPVTATHPLSSTPLSCALAPTPAPPHTGLIDNSGYSPAEAEGKTEEELMAPARRNGAQYLYVGRLE